VPEGAPELPVCYTLEPRILLKPDGLANRLVLEVGEFRRGQRAAPEFLARGEELRRSQEATNVIRTKRRTSALE